MSISGLPAIGYTLTCPDSTTLVAIDDPAFGADAVSPPDNAESVVILNLDSANRIYVKFGSVTAVNASNMTISNSTVIPPLGAMTFDIGALAQQRAPIGSGPRDQVNGFIKPAAGTNLLVNVTYLM